MGDQPKDAELALNVFTPVAQSPQQESEDEPLVRTLWAGVLHLVGVVALLAAISVGVFAYFQLRDNEYPLTLIVGDEFLTLLHVAVPSFVVGIAAIIGAAFIRRHGAGRRGTWARNIVTTVLIALAGLSMPTTMIVSGSQLIASGEYTTLPEQSDGGCRIVVSEHSFLLAGGGRVGIVQPGSVVVQWVRTYRADDGQTPFALGNFRFGWVGQTAELDIYGDSDPVWWTTNGPLVCDE